MLQSKMLAMAAGVALAGATLVARASRLVTT